jgi:hypothetical protein
MIKFPKANAIPKQVTETLASIYQKRNGQRFTVMFDSAMRVVRKQTVYQGGRDTQHDLYGHPSEYKTNLCKNKLAKHISICGRVTRKE